MTVSPLLSVPQKSLREDLPVNGTPVLVEEKIKRAASVLPRGPIHRNGKQMHASHADHGQSELDKVKMATHVVLNDHSGQKESILHDAVRHKRPIKHIERILAAGADPNLPNDQRRTALDLAIADDSVEIAQLLVRHGAMASKKEAFESWIAGKSSVEIEGFLLAGYKPIGNPTQKLPLSTQVLWIRSGVDWIFAVREEITRVEYDILRLREFLSELAYQQHKELPAPPTIGYDRKLILLGWGLKTKYPVLSVDDWNNLANYVEAGIIEQNVIPFSMMHFEDTWVCLNALRALPIEKPRESICPIYDQYVRLIKLELFGTLWKPEQSVIDSLVTKLVWHPKEWELLKKFYRLPDSPKQLTDVLDPSIELYLQGQECLNQGDKEKAGRLFRQAGRRQLPIARIEACHLLIEQGKLSDGFKLIHRAINRGVHHAILYLALSPDIPFSTLEVNFDVDYLIRQLNQAGDPAGRTLASRKALSDLSDDFSENDESKVRKLLQRSQELCLTQFKSEAIAHLKEHMAHIHPTDGNVPLLKKCVEYGLELAIAILAKKYPHYAEQLVKAANAGSNEAMSFAVQMLLGTCGPIDREVEQFLLRKIPLQRVLEEKGINLVDVFKEQLVPDFSEINSLVAKWDDFTYRWQVQMLQKDLPEDLFKEIFDQRRFERSMIELTYLNKFQNLLPVIAAASPSLQDYIRAYKEVLFQDPLTWRDSTRLDWLPCSSADRLVLGHFNFDLSSQFRRLESQNLLPGQEEFLDALNALTDNQVGEAQEYLVSSLRSGFNPAGFVLGELQLNQGDHAQALATFQSVLTNGAPSIFYKLVDACVRLVCEEKMTEKLVRILNYELDNVLRREEVLPAEKLRSFLMKILNPSETDLEFFETAEEIKRCFDDENWGMILGVIGQKESLPIMLKMQLHLVGNKSPQIVSRMSSWLLEEDWEDTSVDSESYSFSGEEIGDRDEMVDLTISYILRSDDKNCKHLMHHADGEAISRWAHNEDLVGEITEGSLRKAELFWKGLARILQEWSKIWSSEVLQAHKKDVHFILNNQTGLAEGNRYYKKCVRLCKGSKSRP